MTRRGFVAASVVLPFLTGCIVAPCPRGIVCGVPAETGGATGSGGSGGGSDGGAREEAGTTVPTGVWVNVTGNLANMTSECGNLMYMSAKPDEDLLIAGIAKDGLWASKDGGASWQPMGTGAGSATITNRPTSIVYDPQKPTRFWESGLYNGGGVYVTNDDGVTFAVLGDSHHVDLVSVDFTDPDRKTILAGGHETTQSLNLSLDQGATWANVGLNLPDTREVDGSAQPDDVCTHPLVLNSTTYLVGCSTYGGGVSGILKSVDSGKTWARLTSSIGGASQPLRASDGAIYWTTADDGLAKSVDNGSTFTELKNSDGVTPPSPSELPDGSIAVIGKEYVMLSSDHGATWRAVSSKLPYDDAVGVTYSVQRKAFYVWHFTCANPVPTDAIMRYDFDYLKD